jgi:hypothetical protein
LDLNDRTIIKLVPVAAAAVFFFLTAATFMALGIIGCNSIPVVVLE